MDGYFFKADIPYLYPEITLFFFNTYVKRNMHFAAADEKQQLLHPHGIDGMALRSILHF